MNIVNAGNRFQVYGEDVQTFHDLPLGTYKIEYSKMGGGLFLASRPELTINEDKIYGHSLDKVKKVMKSYSLMQRNLGVLLSGTKGIGKSLFVRLAAREALASNLPVITVTEAIPGLANFISSIQQDCVVVFDEFEKTFAKQDNWDPQTEMLTLFDGLDGGHKLFIVTCNDLSALSSYMLNRPGRFHYHFTMTTPSNDEIREYLTDKLTPEYWEAIDEIINLNAVIDLPYDYLRAIAFELNQGYSVKETMSDLNITGTNEVHFDIQIYMSNGLIYENWDCRIDFRENEIWKSVRLPASNKIKEFWVPASINIGFNPNKARIINNEYVITDSILMTPIDESDFYYLDDKQSKTAAEKAQALKPIRIVLKRVPAYTPARFLV